MSPDVQPAAPADATAIRALLLSMALPIEDLDPARVRFWIARDGISVVGTIGLESYGESGLLRSLAVSPDHRGLGFGDALVGRLEQSAKTAGIRSLVLLTQTAEEYFARRGYQATSRDLAPRAVQESAEFKSLCPASAVCMVKTLR